MRVYIRIIMCTMGMTFPGMFVQCPVTLKGQMIAQNGFNQGAKMMTISEFYLKGKPEG